MSFPIGLVRGTVTAWCVCFAGTVWAALPASYYGPTYPSTPPNRCIWKKAPSGAMGFGRQESVSRRLLLLSLADVGERHVSHASTLTT